MLGGKNFYDAAPARAIRLEASEKEELGGSASRLPNVDSGDAQPRRGPGRGPGRHWLWASRESKAIQAGGTAAPSLPSGPISSLRGPRACAGAP